MINLADCDSGLQKQQNCWGCLESPPRLNVYRAVTNDMMLIFNRISNLSLEPKLSNWILGGQESHACVCNLGLSCRSDGVSARDDHHKSDFRTPSQHGIGRRTEEEIYRQVPALPGSPA